MGFKKVHVFGDSELIVRQARGQYKINNPALKKLHERVSEVKRSFRVRCRQCCLWSAARIVYTGVHGQPYPSGGKFQGGCAVQ